MNREEIIKEIKEFIRSKEGIVLIGVFIIAIIINIMNTTIKDTHAYYGYESGWVQVFNTKIGDFKPKITSFYIKQSSTPKYTNVGTNTVYLTPGDNNKNLDQVCITETNNIDTCNDKWKTIDTVNNHYEYIFQDTNTEGNKIIYGFVKDKYGNKSLSSQDSIVYDKTAPTINTISTSNLGETSVTLKVNGSDNLSGIDRYCYSTSNSTTDVGTCVTSADGNITINNLKDGQSYTYYFYLIDKAGNSGITNKTQRKFETESAGTGKKLINDRTNIPNLQNTSVNGLYRYYGKYNVVINNYICLGPKGNTCKSDADKNDYLYRIIGIADGSESGALGIDLGSIKVIKAISIGKSQWHSNYETDTDWDGADLQRNLNSTLFYNDTKKLDTRIQSMIKDVKWYKGTITGSSNNPPKAEPTDKISDVHPIGLMYASDYYNSWEAYNGNGNLESWLNITHGASTSSSSYEVDWTMTRFGNRGGYEAWHVWSDGSLAANDNGSFYVDTSFSVRPVFYLESTVTLTGEGTEGNPYIPT